MTFNIIRGVYPPDDLYICNFSKSAGGWRLASRYIFILLVHRLSHNTINGLWQE